MLVHSQTVKTATPSVGESVHPTRESPHTLTGSSLNSLSWLLTYDLTYLSQQNNCSHKEVSHSDRESFHFHRGSNHSHRKSILSLRMSSSKFSKPRYSILTESFPGSSMVCFRMQATNNYWCFNYHFHSLAVVQRDRGTVTKQVLLTVPMKCCCTQTWSEGEKWENRI